MKTLLSSFVAVAGLGFAAHGQLGISRLEIQVSSDGASWHSSIDAMPGDNVQTRYRISLIGSTALGLSGLRLQPTFDGWDGVGTGTDTDRLLPFADVGSNATTPSGGVTDESGAFGRILPFAASSVSTTIRLRGHLEGTRLRVAQSPTTNPIGAGSSQNNINGSGGVPISQSTGFLETPPIYHFGTQNILFLKLGIAISDDPFSGIRFIECNAPIGGFSLFGPTDSQSRAANWHTGFTPSGNPTTNYAPVEVIGARIRIVPSPSVAAILGLFGIVSFRRRR